MRPGFVTVLDIAAADSAWRDHDAVISIEDVETSRRLRVDPSSGVEQLVLQFDDLDFDDGITAVATAAHVAQALDFARRHRGRKLLVHCQAGQCRSPAIALAILRDGMGAGSEVEAVTELLRVRPIAAPNLLALKLADAALGCEGALEAAWLDHERTDEAIARLRFLRQAASELFEPKIAR